MGQLALVVAHHADVQPLRVDLAALAPVPDFSDINDSLGHTQPQALVERLVLAAGAEDRRGLAEHVFGAVAGDALEGRVDVHDHRLGIGDQNALAGAVEYRRGLAQVVFLEPLQGDVAGHASVVRPERRIAGVLPSTSSER